MRAITVTPGEANSARLEDRPEPAARPGALRVRAVALGVCGTDREIVAGDYGWSPPGAARLVLGHESLGRVLEAPAGSGFEVGELVVGVVRRPDPVPCIACAGGEWDMCRNGLYTERGIKEIDGFGAELYDLEPDFAVKVDPALGHLGVLIEPASVLAKAWDHIDSIGRRSRTWRPGRVLVAGAGPVGLLGAMMARQRGLETHVYDRAADGPKPALVRDLGAAYHHGDLGEAAGLGADVILECTGAAPVVEAMIAKVAPGGIVCLVGVSAPGQARSFDLGGFNREMVLGNGVVFGTVNANLGHYEAAAKSLAAADRAWLARLISRRVPLSRWREALDQHADDVKVVVDFEAGDA